MTQAPAHVGRLVEKLLEQSRERRRRAEELRPEIEAATTRVLKQAQEAMQTKRLAHLEACGVEDRVLSVVRDGHAPTPSIEAAREWLRGRKWCLVLCGGAGTGKTVAAALTLTKATRTVEMLAHPLADEPVRFEEYDARKGFFTTMAKLRSSSRYSEGRQMAILEKAATVRWLVLDELRAADLKGAGLERLEEVMRDRHADNLRTVVTTNLSPEQLVDSLAESERLSSRFAEAEVVETGAFDLRKAALSGKAVQS